MSNGTLYVAAGAAGVMPINVAMARVNKLVLTAVSKKLQASDPEKWTDETVNCVEQQYKRFLGLHLAHPGESFVPNALLDEYWHQHILFTQKYAADCAELFGGMLHHDPLFGLRDEEERRENQAGFERLRSMWEFYFGEPLLGAANPCSSTDCR